MSDKKTVIVVDEDLKDLIPFFFEETRKDFDKLRVFLEEMDFPSITRMAHTLKGECGGYGFSFLSDVARELEIFSKNQDQQNCRDHISKMETHLNSVSIEYQKAS